MNWHADPYHALFLFLPYYGVNLSLPAQTDLSLPIMTSFLNFLRHKSMPTIPSKQAPAETTNVVIPEATPSSEEAKKMLKAEKPVSETAAPNITEPVVEEVSAWRIVAFQYLTIIDPSSNPSSQIPRPAPAIPDPSLHAKQKTQKLTSMPRVRRQRKGLRLRKSFPRSLRPRRIRKM